ncbi:hypothetical protein ACIBCC_30025 [Streptomyces griseus]|uniref:hypothetical protein n=1 Tax=Streptomyces griseus TaxID=1911 RepID=UPI0037B876CB
MSKTSAAEAANQAVEWAHCAELANQKAHEETRKAKLFRTQRDTNSAISCGALADEWVQLHSTAVSMANMWANVATALQGTEPGGRP